MPHLQPPSETDLEAAQLALEAKYDEASAMIKELQLSTDSLAASLDDQRADVEKELVQVRKAVEEMREGERRREEWSKKVGEQVDEVVRGLPSVSLARRETPARRADDDDNLPRSSSRSSPLRKHNLSRTCKQNSNRSSPCSSPVGQPPLPALPRHRRPPPQSLPRLPHQLWTLHQ